MKKVTSGELGKFSKKLGKLLGSGVPLVKSLEILKTENIKNELGKVSESVAKMVKNGKGLYEAFSSFPGIFTESYIESVKNGEWTGNLDRVMEKVAENISEGVIQVGEGKNDFDKVVEEFDESNKKVIKFVNHIISTAVNEKAHKIDIWPVHGKAIIKLHIGKEIRVIDTIDTSLYVRAVARVKFMSALDIAEKRLPQDGRILIKIQDKKIDIKVVVLPSIFGEQIVMKLIDHENFVCDPERIFSDKEDMKKIRKLLENESGLVVFAGPSGSGKTTSLMGAGVMLTEEGKSVISIENPVHYVLPGISQIMVREHIGLTMSAAFRAAIRAEPDAIMFGDFNEEIAQEAFNPSHDGILKLTQMGAKSPYEIFRQFLNLNVSPYNLYRGFSGAIFQILMRKLCPHCQKEVSIKAKDLTAAEKKLFKPGKYQETTGCEKCRQTGYLGRDALYEIITPNKELMDAIISGEPKRIQEQTEKLERTSVTDKLATALKSGKTDLSEARRILEKISE